MAESIEEVKPGDLITAELLNAIIRSIKSGVASGGGIEVPSFFGQTLASARTLLQTPGTQIQLGIILDALGNLISATDPATQGSRVLSQTPPAGSRVPPATLISLVISPASTSSGAKPTITSLDKTTVQANSPLHIFGTNFASNPAANEVRVGGISAVVSPASSTTDLIITVPLGAEALPQPVTLTVTVGGQVTNASVTVQPASGTPAPTISALKGSTTNPAAATGEVITITGANFGSNTATVAVFFGPNEASPSSVPTEVAGTTMKVAVPSAFPSLPSASSPPITVRPFVKVGDKAGPPSPVPLQIARLV